MQEMHLRCGLLLFLPTIPDLPDHQGPGCDQAGVVANWRHLKTKPGVAQCRIGKVWQP